MKDMKASPALQDAPVAGSVRPVRRSTPSAAPESGADSYVDQIIDDSLSRAKKDVGFFFRRKVA